eukprot:691756-Pelagomonas_calceolata.AAC.1
MKQTPSDSRTLGKTSFCAGLGDDGPHLPFCLNATFPLPALSYMFGPAPPSSTFKAQTWKG